MIISVAAARLIIDPYLDSLLGGTIMAMNAEIGIVNVLLVFIAFLIIILCVCIRATRRTGKIELSVLLNIIINRDRRVFNEAVPIWLWEDFYCQGQDPSRLACRALLDLSFCGRYGFGRRPAPSAAARRKGLKNAAEGDVKQRKAPTPPRFSQLPASGGKLPEKRGGGTLSPS